MTDEDAFHAAMDEDVNEFTHYLVFADWLDEHNDPRAEGYRALAEMRLRGYRASAEYSAHFFYVWFVIERVGGQADKPSDLPQVWYDELTGYTDFGPASFVPTRELGQLYYPSARASRDAAAAAWTKLSAAYKARAREVAARHAKNVRDL